MSKCINTFSGFDNIEGSILSFNKSICNREDFKTNKSPYQILPGRSYIRFIN